MRGETPAWVNKFRAVIKRLKRKSGSNWYQHPQPNLAKLKRSGRGNCVAWSRLMATIAVRAGLKATVLVIGERYDKSSKSLNHQICVIIDRNNTVWLQSNIWVVRFKNLRGKPTKNKIERTLKEVARQSGKDCGYKTGTVIHSKVVLGEI